MGEIRIGTSGFSYDDWRGYFYPEDIQKGEMLSYYAGRFNTVEVNSTYYAIPSAITFARMTEKTPEGFRFAVKAYKDLTHSDRADIETFRRFVSALRPLVASGKLGCVLAQYPWSFKKSVGNTDRLKELSEFLSEMPVVVEFRNASWVSDDTFDLLRALGLGFCCVDEPRLKGLMPPISIATSAVGYVRFHGRNAGKWWQHEQPWERYDYLYTEGELRMWVPRIKQLAVETEHAYVFFNNHYQGKAAQNAQMMVKMLEMAS